MNLEDGEERFQAVVPLARRYGAALVVGCIDDDKDQAQAITRERKLEVALRSAKLLTEKYGVPEEDLIFDPLVFPCGTGDANYIGSGAETVEGVRLIKVRRCRGPRPSWEFPTCRSVFRQRGARFSTRCSCTTACRLGWTWPSSTRS